MPSARTAFATLPVRGRGRVGAAIVLIAIIGLQIALPQFLQPLRFALFDLYQQISPRQRLSAPAVIVAVDEKSLETVGQWPWPRQIEATLIQTILAAHPAVLGIDILWPEADRSSPTEWLRQEKSVSADLAATVARLPDHDALLRTALASGPVAIGIAGTRDGTSNHPGPLAPIRRIGGTGASLDTILPSFTGTVRSIPQLDHAAAGHGVLSVDLDADGAVRRLPMMSVLAGRPAPSLSLEMIRLAANAPWLDLDLTASGISSVTTGPLTIPTQADGSIWIDYSPHDPRRFVSAADVLAGKVSADTFNQRLVLLGVTGLGLVDLPRTPLGRMPGVEIHAELLENIIEGRLASRPAWTTLAEPGLTLGFGMLLIAILPMLRLRWYAPMFAFPILALAGAGLALWREKLWLIDIAAPSLGLALVFVALLGGSLAEVEAQRRRLRREIERRKIESARIDGELAAARRIQMGILPQPSDLPADPRFDLDACIIPAREVGGDLYDFFAIDDDHLFFAIGDVTGKGIPASLFMALGKSLCKSCALRGDGEIGAIVAQANEEISRDNPEMLFITLFAGILNLVTGQVYFCNAGHDAPILLQAGTPPRAVDCEGGPPLCVMENFPYATESLKLAAGDILCLTTDGVTEAMNRDGALMGRDRVDAVLTTLPPETDAANVLRVLCSAVAIFADGADPADDLTVLTIRWHGSPGFI